MALEKITLDRIAVLHPDTRSEIKELLERAEAETGKRLRVVQGLRTIEYQNALYAQGRTKPGKIVTDARGGSSFHNYGLAIDICYLIKQEDGSYKYDEKKSWEFGEEYKKIIKIFKDAGYVWGGDWKSIKDKPHFEKNFGLGWRDLFKKYTNKDFIPGTEYVKI